MNAMQGEEAIKELRTSLNNLTKQIEELGASCTVCMEDGGDLDSKSCIYFSHTKQIGQETFERLEFHGETYEFSRPITVITKRYCLEDIESIRVYYHCTMQEKVIGKYGPHDFAYSSESSAEEALEKFKYALIKAIAYWTEETSLEEHNKFAKGLIKKFPLVKK
jgi:hypothetical protein